MNVRELRAALEKLEEQGLGEAEVFIDGWKYVHAISMRFDGHLRRFLYVDARRPDGASRPLSGRRNDEDEED